MEIWLLRHAAAEDRASSGKDADRALTREGRERARRVGRGIAVLVPGISRVLASPYLRARETAEPAALALGKKVAIEESEALEPDRDPEEVLDEIRADAGGDAAVLLVGHEPHLGRLLGHLLFGRGGTPIPLRKAAAARVSWDGRGTGALRALLPAGVLERLGK